MDMLGDTGTRIFSTLHSPSFLSLASTPTVPKVQTNYSSALNSTSPIFTRLGATGEYYYEPILVNVSTSGNYTFLSSSGADAYGYLYTNSINASDLSANLVSSDDELGGAFQFLITADLQAGVPCIIVFTTFSAGVTAPFSVTVTGPAASDLSRGNLIAAASSFTSTPSTSCKCMSPDRKDH